MKRIRLEDNVKRFDRTLNELKGENPTDGMEAFTSVEPQRTKGKTWWLAAGAAATVVAALAMLALPAKSEAVRLQDISNAIESKQISHTVTYHLEGPEPNKQTSEAWSAGKWTRFDVNSSLGGKTWMICDGATTWHFNSINKTMIVTKSGIVFYGGNTLPELLESIKKRRSGTRVELQEKTRGGKRILELTEYNSFKANEKNYPLKTVWIANADDKLPREVLHYQATHSDDGRKVEMRLIARGRVEFPATLPKEVFDHDLPSGWKLATPKK